MHRTQLYLDDSIWDALRSRARTQKTTISHLVREAVRDRYLSGHEERKKAMMDFVGIRREPTDAPDAVDYIRALRAGDRLERLRKL